MYPYFPNDIFSQLVELARNWVKKTKFESTRREDTQMRKVLYEILDLFEKRVSDSDRFSDWFKLQQEAYLDKSNNINEAFNKKLGDRIIIYKGNSPIRKLMSHKAAFYSLAVDSIIELRKLKSKRQIAHKSQKMCETYYDAVVAVQYKRPITEVFEILLCDF